MAQKFQQVVGRQEITVFESLQDLHLHVRYVSGQELSSKLLSQLLKLNDLTE